MKKWWLIGLLALCACSSIRQPVPVFKFTQVLHYRTPFEPPKEYVKWWSEVEKCTKISRPIEEISFYDLDIKGDEFYFEGFQFSTLALYWDNDQSITVIRNQKMVKWKVKHEMIHALIHTKNQEHIKIFFKCV